MRVWEKPEDLISWIPDYGLVIGMRFHALVLATKANVAYVGWGNQSKVRQFCVDQSQPFWDFDRGWNAESVLRQIVDAWGRRAQAAKPKTTGATVLVQTPQIAVDEFVILAKNALIYQRLMQKGIFSVLSLAAAVGGLATFLCVAARGMNRAQAQIHETLPVAVFFQANLPDDQARATAAAWVAQDKAIQRVSYLSRDQAYADASKDPLLARSLMLLHDNPLTATAEIHYNMQAWIARTDPAEVLRTAAGVQDIRWSAPRRDALLAFEPWKAALSRSLWAAAVLFMLWSLCGVAAIVSETARGTTAFSFFFAGLLGGASMTLIGLGLFARLDAAPLPLSWRAVPLLPTLFGGLIGLGFLREVGA